jgi:hypothetical protein
VAARLEPLLQGTGEPSERLFTRRDLCRRLGVSPATLDRLARDGLPCVRVGAVPRYEWHAVRARLQTRQGDR